MESVLLRVAEQGRGFRVELRRRTAAGGWSDAPQATELIPLDLDAAAAPATVRGADIYSGIEDFVRDNRQSESFDAIGEFLGGVLLRGAVRIGWEDLRRQQQDAGGLRTLLQLEPTELRRLPWELMRCNDELLFIDDLNPMARVRAIDPEAAPAQLLPIRLLVVEGERNSDLGTDAEVHAIKRALARCGGRIDAEFLTAPSWQLLSDTYQRLRPHVFHFIGHGVPVTASDKSVEPALSVFDNAGQTAWQLTRRHFLDLLRPAPRLAVLNACRSGTGASADGAGDQARDLALGLRNLADTLLTKGSAAVVAMQGDVQGRAAARFGGALYDALAAEKLIDEAVAHARRAVYSLVGITQQERDWFLPSLTLRVDPERVLPTRCMLGTADRAVIVDQQLTPRITPFVDRVGERHQVVAGIDPESGDPARLLVVTGSRGSGKTRLLQWVQRRCVLRGQRVRYVDFRGESRLDFHQALYAIRDTEEAVPLRADSAAATAFRQFDHEIQYLAAGQMPKILPEAPPLADPPPAPATFEPGPVEVVERAVGTFLAALNQATSSTPLVLVLDHLDGLLDAGFEKVLYPLLIRRIAAHQEAPNVRLVVVLSAEQQHLWPKDDARLGTWVAVEEIEADRFVELFDDFVLALGGDLTPEEVSLRNALASYHQEAWSLSTFETYRKILERRR